MNVKAAAAATNTPVAVDRGWEKACRCTAVAVVGAPDVAQAAVEPRAVMSERPS